MRHSGGVMRRPSLISAGLGLVALVLTGVVVGRVAADEDGRPADFTPVVVSTVRPSSPTPPPSPRPPSIPVSAQTPAPKPQETREPFTQIKPTPRDIDDDKGDDRRERGADDGHRGDHGDAGRGRRDHREHH
jgi:hypothetical protein